MNKGPELGNHREEFNEKELVAEYIRGMKNSWPLIYDFISKRLPEELSHYQKELETCSTLDECIGLAEKLIEDIQNTNSDLNKFLKNPMIRLILRGPIVVYAKINKIDLGENKKIEECIITILRSNIKEMRKLQNQ